MALEEGIRHFLIVASDSSVRSLVIRLPFIGLFMKELAEGSQEDQSFTSNHSLAETVRKSILKQVEHFLFSTSNKGSG
jgi:hypothetical protein